MKTNTIYLNTFQRQARQFNKGHLLFGLLLLLWMAAPGMIQHLDQTAGLVDQGIWLLILLSMICFLGLSGLSWWLLQQFWLILGLPEYKSLIIHFKSMELWQQLGFYWASFALLLLAATGCLIGIC